MMRQDDRVIVVGAGPVGAVTALALVKKGIPVTLVEADPEPPEDQRAATIHPPTVEMLAELGLTNEAFADDASGGLISPIFHFRDRVSGGLVAVFDLGLLKGEVPYPFVMQWEQYKLVRAGGEGLGDSAPTPRRAQAHLRGRDAAQAVPLSLIPVRQPQVRERGGVSSRSTTASPTSPRSHAPRPTTAPRSAETCRASETAGRLR
jgi:choline dehydrogenase-like flavoprotein